METYNFNRDLFRLNLYKFHLKQYFTAGKFSVFHVLPNG